MRSFSEEYQIKIASKAGRLIKKFPSDLKASIDEQLDKILENPSIGELKKGPLKGIRVHKFKYYDIEYLLSYELLSNEKVIAVYAVGPHENYYKNLWRYVREIR